MATKFSVEATFKARDRMSRVSSRMGRKWVRTASRMERATKGVTLAVKGLAKGFKFAAVAAGAAGAAVGLVAKNVIEVGSGFEEAITAVGAVGLKTREEIADLEQKAKQLGATTKFTATEAANAMEIMARAGFKNQEILGGIDGILSAAAASGLEIAEVADHVSNALKGMGLETSEAGRVADVLALASARTNSTIGTLGESIRNVASTARQLGIPFEEATAAVALLQDVGLDASVAGSSLNTMLTKMAKPPAKIAAQMKKFGVSFKDAKGNMLPFEQVIANVSEAAKKAGGNFDQVAFLADLVGLRGQKAAANLAKLFEEGRLGELTAELKNAEGAAAKMAALRMNNLRGDWILLGSAVDAVKVALFDAESGPLRKFVQRMTDWVGKNQGKIVEKIGKVIENIGKVAGVVWPIVKRFFDTFIAGLTKSQGASNVQDMIDNLAKTLGDPEFITKAERMGRTLATIVAKVLELGGAISEHLPTLLRLTPMYHMVTAGLELWEGAIRGATFVSDALKVAMFGMQVMLDYLRGRFAVVTEFVGGLIDKLGSLGVVGEAIKFVIDGITGAIGLFVLGIKTAVDHLRKLLAVATAVKGSIGETAAKIEARGGSRTAGPPVGSSENPAQQIDPAAMVAPRVSPTAEASIFGEIKIADETNRARVTRQTKGVPMAVIHTQPSGAF